VLVSACLLGVACNHRGEGSAHPDVVTLGRSHQLIPVCPEVAGGLPTPRPAAERSLDGRVCTAGGEDVTVFYQRGAAHALGLATAAGVTWAVLKARSPSCGTGRVYDGSHQRILRDGDGMTAEVLRAAGIAVSSEEDLGESAVAAQQPDVI
jgi:uncharacterized protein YbbK (DUF523 family)